jgi:hypothetical protein
MNYQWRQIGSERHCFTQEGKLIGKVLLAIDNCWIAAHVATNSIGIYDCVGRAQRAVEHYALPSMIE